MVKDPLSCSSCEHEWERIALQKRTDRENALAKFADWRTKVLEPTSDVSQLPLQKLTDGERNIVKCDATGLADLIRKRVYTSVEVVLAFAKAAVVAQDVTNCLTEIFIEDALDRAQELDKHLEVSGNVVGPLHGQPSLIFCSCASVYVWYHVHPGVPVSIKDHIKIKGLDTSTGYVGSCLVARQMYSY
jgi:amidase